MAWAATRFFSDRAGRPTRTVHPDGGEESKEYDLNGNPVLTTALTGLRTRVEYDAANRAVLAVADLNGDGAFDAGPGSPDAATRTAYDAVGNPVRVTDPEGAVADTEYDAFGRPTRVTGPPVPDWRRGGALARPATTTEYDGCGRPTRVVDAMGVATVNAYDGLGRLVRSEAGGVATEREHDAEGNVLSLSHGRPGQGDGRTTWEYDALNRKVREVRPLGRATEWARDAAGRVARERRPSGRAVVNAHSPSGLLLSARFWAPGASAPAEEREFRHDACMEIRFTDNPLAEENIGTFLHKEYQYLLDNKYGTGLQNTKDGWILVRNK